MLLVDASCLPACLPACSPGCLPAHLLACLPACLLACLPVRLPACLSASQSALFGKGPMYHLGLACLLLANINRLLVHCGLFPCPITVSPHVQQSSFHVILTWLACCHGMIRFSWLDMSSTVKAVYSTQHSSRQFTTAMHFALCT